MEVPLPEDLQYYPNVQVHRVRFDPTRAAAGAVFDMENYAVTQNVSSESHKCVFALEGFESGVHYWSLRITDDSVNKFIMIGVSKNVSTTESTYPGHGNDKGVGYYGENGFRYFGDTHAGFGKSFGTGDVVGVLLNMRHKTVSFYLNGSRVGTAIGSDQLTDDVYYPVVTLHSLGHTVVSISTSVPHVKP